MNVKSSGRHLALQDLSRDHHEALVQALRLIRGGYEEDEQVDDRELAREFLNFWYDHSRWHFREEEEVLLPVYSRRKDPMEDSDIQTMLEDHAWFRDQIYELEDQLEKGGELRELLEEIGKRLQNHARLEEREIFERMQSHLTDKDLKDIHERSRDFRIRWRGVDSCGPGEKTVRNDLFARLSEDHNRILMLARKCKDLPADVDESSRFERAREFLEFWEVQMKLHLREEDEILLPAAGRHLESEENENLSTLVEDHKLIRDAISDLESSLNNKDLSRDQLIAFSSLIKEHVMFEEQDLYPALKEMFSEDVLEDLLEESNSFREKYRTPGGLENDLGAPSPDTS